MNAGEMLYTCKSYESHTNVYVWMTKVADG